ncbi:MAG TPA: membrane protein insertase YidC, partial [Actinomycetota bacterium]|nr:membrane protein insertase YidC [Actinomycetota bacterium]
MIWDSLLKGLGSILSFFYEVIPNYGVAIILLTILVRIVMIPLTIKQTRSMQEMQRIQPKVKELQRKYKGNRQKMNEELMKLYKEHQVNPLGGCLPLLLQLPV